MKLVNTAIAFGLGLAAAAAPAMADRNDRVPELGHAFVILMENHAYAEIKDNPNAPFTNSYAQAANLATNYYGVGHPSLTNYLEIIGGSNFGIRNDNSPAWHSTVCMPEIARIPSLDPSGALEGSPNVCPISGSGFDAPTPALDYNEGAGIDNRPFVFDSAPTVGKSIADQLQERGMSWKSYQENLPPFGADRVNNSDGLLADDGQGATTSAPLPKLYAVKHNPFVYFASVQQGGLKNIVDFGQLYRDLRSGNVPNLAFIAPNQCHDQHGRAITETGTGCNYNVSVIDPNTGTVTFGADANQKLISQGDAALSNLVTAIKASPAWTRGERSAIIVVWDENDYSTNFDNRVVAIVDTNYGVHGVKSDKLYSHFSLLKTLEAGFELPYLNHAADAATPLMTDLFAAQ
jgi:phosphatidylinositol-3-phosphatase